jgi:RimJ/RimL family protein N-acetyltransferase
MQNENIKLRYIKPSDIEDYKRWATIDTEWQDWDAPWEDDDDGNFVERQIEALTITPKVFYKLEIDTIDGRHIGWVSSYKLSDSEQRAVGIDIPSVQDRGKGYGENALALFMAYLFNDREELYTETWSGNIPMIRLAEKIGFLEVDRVKDFREVRGQKYDGLTFKISKENFYMKYPNLREKTFV